MDEAEIVMAGGPLAVRRPRSDVRPNGQEVTTHVIDQQVVQQVAAAMAQGYRITVCPECGTGPLVHSKTGVAARCFSCGYFTGEKTRRCLKCQTPITSSVPDNLALEAANGRARVEEMKPFMTCQACGGQAEAASTVRRSCNDS